MTGVQTCALPISVRGLYIRLTKDGVDAWLDKEKLLPGQDWELEIRKAVRTVYF